MTSFLPTSHASNPLPVPGKGLPTFTLPDTAGTLRRLWEYKQRHPVALFVPHAPGCAGCRAWLQKLGASQARLDEMGAAVLVLVRAPLDEARALQAALDLSFTFLVDAGGSVTTQYTRPGTATLYLGDRYLQCLDRWTTGENQHELPLPDDVIATLTFAEQEDCGCGLPAWPEDALE